MEGNQCYQLSFCIVALACCYVFHKNLFVVLFIINHHILLY